MAFLTNVQKKTTAAATTTTAPSSSTTTAGQIPQEASMQKGSTSSSSPRVETPTRLSLEQGTTTSSSCKSASVNDALRLPSTTDTGSPPSLLKSHHHQQQQQQQQQQHGGYSPSPGVVRGDDTISRNGILPHQEEEQLKNNQQQHIPPSTSASPPEQPPLRRITSSLAASSAVVHSLFGESVGPCWGDFSCSHMRIQGRLYATSQAILFYTNLLGFERRICLLLRDVVELELFRTTSIRMETMDGETYIFRSFNDREQVLHVLNGLTILAQRKNKQQRPQQQQHSNTFVFNRRRNDSEDPSSSQYRCIPAQAAAATPMRTSQPSPGPPTLQPRVSSSSRQQQPEQQSTAVFDEEASSSPPNNWPLGATSPPSSPRMIFNRQRASSDSIVRVIHDTTTSNNFLHQPQSSPSPERHPSAILSSSSSSTTPRPMLEPIHSSDNLTAAKSRPNTTSSPPISSDPHASLPVQDSTEPEEDDAPESPPHVVWANIQQTKNSLLEVGLESLSIPCSLDDYHKLFLADNARYSLDYYQKEYIKDRNVSITGWDVGADGVSFHRTISFTHPIKNSMGIGPSSAQTCRQQRFRKFPGIGLALENTTVIEGIPGADCFHIQDIWLLEFVNESESRLSVHFDIIFKKRSMFKSIIQKNVRKETKQWIAGYVDMVEACLDDEDTTVGENHPSKASSSHEGTAVRETPPVISSSESFSKLEDSILIVARKMELAYWLIAALVLILILVVGFFGYHMLAMQRLVLELQAQLHQIQSA